MAAARRAIDVDETLSLTDVLEEVEHGHAPIELRRAGRIVAVVSPPDSAVDRNTTPQSMLAFAGLLRDDIPDEFQAVNAELRATSTRTFDWE